MEDTREIQVKRVPGKTIKLTVTSERVTIKIPEYLILEETKDLMVFLLLVAGENPNPEFTLRGDDTEDQLRKYGITLRTQSKSYAKRYPYPTEDSQTFP